MALQSQGCKIRRQATAAGATAVTNLGADTAFNFISTGINCPNATGAFVTAGFTTGMRVWTNSTVNPGGFTVRSVAATVLGVFETMATSTGLSFVVYGAAMSDIGSITNFSVPSGSPSIIDVSNLQSAAKEKLIGMVDEGQFTFEVNVDSSDSIQWQHLKWDRSSRIQRTFDVQFTDKTNSTDSSSIPSQALFNGYVTGFSVSGAVDQAVKASITIEIDGPVRWSTKAS